MGSSSTCLPRAIRCSPGVSMVGIGLLETLIALAVGAVMASQALPALREQLDLWRLESASADVGRMLRLARQQSAVRRSALRLEVDATSGTGACLLLHSGGPMACRGCTGPAVCNPNAQLLARSAPTPAGLSLQATSTSLLWSPASGTVTPTGTFRLWLTSPRTGLTPPEVLHVVNLLGRARSCSNDARVRFHVAC